MIWFTCKKCGKTHGRADNSAGTMIFCECGNGNTVPWESTVVPPALPAVVEAPKVPELGPIQFEPVSLSSSAPASAATPSTYPTSKPFPAEDDDRPYRRGRLEKRDPEFCFNHQRRPKLQRCAECEESFCGDCLVTFQDALLCAPCKNFRARRQELPPAASTMAKSSLVISLLAGPLLMCLLLKSPSNPMHVVSWLSLLPQFLALGMGIWAIRDAENEKKGGGQWVAVTGIALSAVSCILVALLNWFTYRIA